MQSKDITKIGLAAVLAASTGLLTTIPAAPARAAEVDGPEVKWLVSLWGARRGFTEGIEGLAKYVSDKTDGNFELSLQYGEVLSSSRENLDGLHIGAFEVGTFCASYHPDKTPALGGLDLAFLPIASLEARAKVVEDYYQLPVIQEEFGKWNTVPLMGILMPSYEAMGTGEPPETLEDWKGIRISSLGGVGQLMSALGASVTVVTAPDMFQSMERGLIDAATFPYTYAFASYRLHEIADWVTDNWGLGATVCHSAVNKGAYDALPDQYKELLREGVAAGYEQQIEKYREVDIVNEAAFEEAGLIRVPLTDEVRAAIEAAAEPSWNAWVASATEQGLPAQELLDSILESAAAAE